METMTNLEGIYKKYYNQIQEMLNNEDELDTSMFDRNYLWRFKSDYGNLGAIEGMFIATSGEVYTAFGEEVYFGEMLGRGQEVYGELSDDNLTQLNIDEDSVNEMLDILGKSCSGTNPLEFVRYRCTTCGDLYYIDDFDTTTGRCALCEDSKAAMDNKIAVEHLTRNNKMIRTLNGNFLIVPVEVYSENDKYNIDSYGVVFVDDNFDYPLEMQFMNDDYDRLIKEIDDECQILMK